MREIHQLGPSTKEWLSAGRRTTGPGKPHMRYAGFTDAGPGYSFVRQDPAFSMILIGEAGEGRVSLGQDWVPCPAGHAYLSSPRFPHAYHIKPGARWRLHWVIYWEEGLLPGLSPGSEPKLMPVEASALRHAIEGLCAEQRTQANPAHLELWGSLVDRQVLRLLQGEGEDPRLARLWQEVGQGLGESWTLSRLAACAGLGEENLRRLCLKQHGRSPMAQLTQLRMQHAADLLRLGDEKLASIASRLGYADPFSFSAAFKRCHGQSPRQMRGSRNDAKNATKGS